MKRLKMRIRRPALGFLILFILVAAAGPSIAETRYVSDLLIISVREAQTEDTQIVGYLISDTPVEVVEESEDGEQVKIISPEGLEGWVKKKYLVSKTPKGLVIEELKGQVKELEEKIVLLQQATGGGEPAKALAEYTSRIDALEKELKNERQTVAGLKNELAQAAVQYKKLSQSRQPDPALRDEILALQKKNQELSEQLRTRRQSSEPSFFSGNMKWFMTGAGVLLLGFFIGRSIRRKRTYGY